MKELIITEEFALRLKQEHEDFLREFKHVNAKFEVDNQKVKLEDSLYELTKRYIENYAVCLEFVDYGEKLMDLGNKELGTSYLMKLCCETTSNYEESIEFRELPHVWEILGKE